jgi:hypothetical protein
MLRILTMLFILNLLFLPFAASAQDAWELKSEKNGIKVYFKKTTSVYEIKLVTSIQSSLSGIIQLFNEVENFPKWGYKVTEAKLLKKVSDNESYYHSKFDFPWPMDDRDVVMHTKLEQDPKTKTVTSTSTAAPTFIPEEKNYLRMTNSNTKWTLVPGTNGWLYVEYYIYSSPGGSIPDWLVNAAIEVGPRETIKNMKTILQQPTYKKAKLAYIKE